MPDVFISEEKKGQPFHHALTSRQLMNAQPQTLPYFSSYCKLPEGISFENQEPNEIIILFLRKHFITNIVWIIASLFLLLLPPVIFIINSFINTIGPILPIGYFLIIVLLYYMIVIGFIFNNFVTWFYNFGIITNEQIIDLDFKDIMYRTVAKARIQDVVDVEFEQGGILHSFFEYGNVFIQTEGVKPNFEFHAIPFPDKVTDIILDLKQKATP